jgi:hypothetical protein
MKKTGLIALAVTAFMATTVSAQIADTDFAVSLVGTNTAAKTYVIRGELEGVYVDVPANATNTVVITSKQGTLLSKASIAADVWYLPRLATHTTAGAAATFNVYSSTNSLTANAQTWYSKAAMAGPITVTVTGENAGLTNSTTTTVTLIYRK